MKMLICLSGVLCFMQTLGQNKTKITAPQVYCNETADSVKGIYTNHLNQKYGPVNLKGTAAERTVMMENLIAIEKMEEQSRLGFTLTGCAARVSFARWDNSVYGKSINASYGYQLGVYQYVCHVKEHIPKIVDEYRTVFRVDINPNITTGAKAGGTGEFSINGLIRYQIPIEAKLGPDYENEKKNSPSKVSQYITEATMLANRSSDYKNKHADFLKIINGDGYTENWLQGSKYDKRSVGAYQWINRHYMITKPGIPLLIPVSRKQYLEDMLEYLEIEKANFEHTHLQMEKAIANETAEWAIKRRAVLQEDKLAYPKIYEAKKAKIKELLSVKKADWLEKQAVVENNSRTYDANKRLENFGKFYEVEDDYNAALYMFNPAYFKFSSNKPAKPLFIEIQFRYELGKGREFSERLFNNFLKNFDIRRLSGMLE